MIKLHEGRCLRVIRQ